MRSSQVIEDRDAIVAVLPTARRDPAPYRSTADVPGGHAGQRVGLVVDDDCQVKFVQRQRSNRRAC